MMTGLSSRPKTEEAKMWWHFNAVAIGNELQDDQGWLPFVFDLYLIHDEGLCSSFSINFHFRPCRRFLAELQGVAMALYRCDKTNSSQFSAASDSFHRVLAHRANLETYHFLDDKLF